MFFGFDTSSINEEAKRRVAECKTFDDKVRLFMEATGETDFDTCKYFLENYALRMGVEV